MSNRLLGGRQVRLIPPGTTIQPYHGLLHSDLAIQKSDSLREVSPTDATAYAGRHAAPVAPGNQPPIRRYVIALPWPEPWSYCRRLLPRRQHDKRTYRSPQGSVLYGVPRGQMDIERINNNNTLPLTVLAAVAFTPDLPPVDTNPLGYRPRAHSLDSAPMLPKAVVIGWGGGGGHSGTGKHFRIHGYPTTTGEHWNAHARTAWQPAHCSNELVQKTRSTVLG